MGVVVLASGCGRARVVKNLVSSGWTERYVRTFFWSRRLINCICRSVENLLGRTCCCVVVWIRSEGSSYGCKCLGDEFSLASMPSDARQIVQIGLDQS